MIAFADSSAVVTTYAPAERDVLPPGTLLVVSVLARVEVVSALWRKAAVGDATVEQASRMIRVFEADWRGSEQELRRFEPIPLSNPVLVRAAGLTVTHRLRTLDAVQLASALAARNAEPECGTMIVLDDRLRRAAAAEGFTLVPA